MASSLAGLRHRGPSINGPVSLRELSDKLFAVLEQELDKGPVAHGRPGRTWTLARIKTLIGRRFRKSFTLSGISRMLRRYGWSHQVPARRAVERDEASGPCSDAAARPTPPSPTPRT